MINFNISFFDAISIGYKFDRGFTLDRIPPINRRRLSNAAKSVFTITNDLKIDMPVIFSSYQGELARNFDLLENLKNEVSPTSFSLSVLNAIPAILNMDRKNQSEILAISSKSSVEFGIINALKHEKALVFSYFEGVKKDYYEYEPFCITLCIIVEKGDKFSLSYAAHSNAKETDSTINFLDNFSKNKSWQSYSDGLKWSWRENY